MTNSDRRREFNQQLDPINWPAMLGGWAAGIVCVLIVLLGLNLPL